MAWPDVVNAIFECAGGFFVALSARKTLQDKKVRGVSWMTAAFFTSWGIWNLYFYPSLEQWTSFFGGIFVCTANIVWLSALIYYTRKERREGPKRINGIDPPERGRVVVIGLIDEEQKHEDEDG